MKKLFKAIAMLLLVAMLSMVAANAMAEEATGEPFAPVTVEQTVNEPTATEQPAATQVPAVTEQPAVVADAEATPAATEEVAPEATAGGETAPDLSNVSITTKCITSGILTYGDTITVIAQIAGLDGVTYGMQWQYFDGTEWKDQAGANDSSCSFTLSETNANYLWRMVITVG